MPGKSRNLPHRVPLITATPGNVVDFRAVEDTVRDLCDRFDVQQIAFDPALARNVLNNLLDDGLRPLSVGMVGYR